eukprot:14793580-Heterocapsa_arctica.AAC.1
MECDHLASLWDFAGRPPMAGLVPSRHAPGWILTISALRIAVRADFKLPPFRTWPALWSVLHHSPPPVRTNWHTLLGGVTVGELRARLNDAPRLAGTHLVSWNVWWLLSPHTAKAAAKRSAILNQLNAGRMVCLQETHWHDAAAA